MERCKEWTDTGTRVVHAARGAGRRMNFDPIAPPFPRVLLSKQLLTLGITHTTKAPRSHPIPQGRLGYWMLTILQ